MKIPIGTFSFYNQLDQCPHKAYHIYIGKTVPFVKTPEMAWGDTVHQAFENRIKHGSPLPDNIGQVAENIATVFYDFSRVTPVSVELQLAMTQDGKPCDYYGENAWFRGKLDCIVFDAAHTHAWLVDWKTGNTREDPFELECGALLLKTHYPELKSVTGEYFWLKAGKAGLRYTIADHANTYRRLWKLRGEAEEYLRTAAWPKRKTPLCDWCPIKTCEHYTGRKVK